MIVALTCSPVSTLTPSTLELHEQKTASDLRHDRWAQEPTRREEELQSRVQTYCYKLLAFDGSGGWCSVGATCASADNGNKSTCQLQSTPIPPTIRRILVLVSGLLYGGVTLCACLHRR